jgi:hypothetical protein
MKRIKKISLSARKRHLGWTNMLGIAGIGMIALGSVSCVSNEMLDAGMSIGGGYLPGPARSVVSAMRQLKAIAEYQATEKQLATAQSKAQRSSSSERQYIRVKPAATSTQSSTRGTHVVAYEPSTGKLDDEVLVVPETNLAKGESVSINGQSGKII